MVAPTRLYSPDEVTQRIVLLRAIMADALQAYRDLAWYGRRRKRAKSARRIRTIDAMIARCEGDLERYQNEVRLVGGVITDLDSGEVTFSAWLKGDGAYIVWLPNDRWASWWRPRGDPALRTLPPGG